MYSMNEDIELMESAHDKEEMSEEDIEQIIHYWKNDIKATYKLWQYCIGETDHPDYKGKNKVQLRLDLIEEMKLPHTAVNWNDVKIGAELNKKTYLELCKIDHKQLWEKVNKRKTKTGFKFKECYPKYIKFETEKFKKLFKQIGETVVNLNEKQEFEFTYNDTEYTIAKGGGHSGEKARLIEADDEYIIIDCDIASMYPNIIRKRNLYPAHLGPKWNEAYISNIGKRLEAKKKFKENKEKKYDNFQECFKLVLNGNFGRLGDRYDFQYDPFVGMCVTIGGQVDIYMLVEDLEEAGIHVVSLNTDGITCKFKRSKLQQYYKICKDWEKQVGNDDMGNLEYVEYEKLIQLSVNDYIAIKKGDWKEIDGEFVLDIHNLPVGDKKVKRKGDFLVSYELHKNKSKSIVPIALSEYYVNNIPIEETIKNHKDIYAFSIAKKASRDYSYQGTTGNGTNNTYHRLIRYYCSTKEASVAQKLWKVKNEGSLKTGPERSMCESTSKYQVVINQRTDIPTSTCIDYDWYIEKTREIIAKIEPEKKLEFAKYKTLQATLF